jgi:hypothetical protein
MPASAFGRDFRTAARRSLEAEPTRRRARDRGARSSAAEHALPRARTRPHHERLPAFRASRADRLHGTRRRAALRRGAHPERSRRRHESRSLHVVERPMRPIRRQRNRRRATGRLSAVSALSENGRRRSVRPPRARDARRARAAVRRIRRCCSQRGGQPVQTIQGYDDPAVSLDAITRRKLRTVPFAENGPAGHFALVRRLPRLCLQAAINEFRKVTQEAGMGAARCGSRGCVG